jgi:ribose transport system substrate-binding protein
VYAYEDPDLQSRQIIDLAGEGIDALLLNPVSDSVIAALDTVISMGIPVFTIDRGISSDGVVCHIASDNRAGGRMAGDYLAEALNRQGRVVEIMGTEGSSAAAERGLGFREAMAAYTDIEIVRSFHAGFDRDLAMEGFLELLKDTVTVDAVFAHNDDMILGAMEAAEASGVAGILFIGFDAIDEAIDAVERGELLATVAQRPAEMGRLGVETAVDYLSGLEVPDSIIVDLALILR